MTPKATTDDPEDEPTRLRDVQGSDRDALADEWRPLHERLKETGARLDIEEREDFVVDLFDSERYYVIVRTRTSILAPDTMAVLGDAGVSVSRREDDDRPAGSPLRRAWALKHPVPIGGGDD